MLRTQRKSSSTLGERSPEVLNIHRPCGLYLRASCQCLIRLSESKKPAERGTWDHKHGTPISKQVPSHCILFENLNRKLGVFFLPTSPQGTASMTLAGDGV